MRRVKWFTLPTLLAAVLFLAPDDSQGQPPGGFGGGPDGFGGGGRGGGPGGGSGRGGQAGFDPGMMWDRMAQGQDSINLNDPRFGWMKGMMERQGTPVPANGVLTKQQYMAGAQQRMAQMQAGGGPGGGRGAFGAPPGGMTMTFQGGPPGADGKPVMMMQGPPGMNGGFGGQPGGFGGGPGGPGGGRGAGQMQMGADGQMTDESIRMMMQRTDTDGDGRISWAEAQSNDRLRNAFQQYDRNGDGYIDVSEYRQYVTDRFANRNNNGGPGGGPNGFNGGPPGGFNPGGMPPGGQPNFGGPPNGQPGFTPPANGDRRGNGEEETPRPEVHRYGKLPKGLPSWFEDLDTDKDGMIGLYEWRRAGKPTAEFVQYDLNGDGYLTADEWMRYQKQQIEKRASEDGDSPRPSTAPAPGSAGAFRGGPPTGGDFPGAGAFPGGSGKDGKGKKGNRDGSGKKDRNPFNN